MRFVTCDGCGKRLNDTEGPMPPGMIVVHVRISSNDAETHACSHGCLEPAVKAAATAAIQKMIRPRE